MTAAIAVIVTNARADPNADAWASDVDALRRKLGRLRAKLARHGRRRNQEDGRSRDIESIAHGDFSGSVPLTMRHQRLPAEIVPNSCGNAGFYEVAP
jgi:hypothetical protein